MNSFFAVKFFGEAFITLLVITDPPGVVPPFIGLTRGLPGQVRARLAWQAAVVALGVILAFAVSGQTVLPYLGIEVAALPGAGGLLLLLGALQLLTGQLEEPTGPNGPGPTWRSCHWVLRTWPARVPSSLPCCSCGGPRPARTWPPFWLRSWR